MKKYVVSLTCAVALAPLGALATPITAQAAPSRAASFVLPAAASGVYKNCTALNKKYKHGLGRANARDKTSGKRVTNFTKSTTLYNAAMRANRGLDRDKDGIACEKR